MPPLLQRVQDILLKPKDTWPVIAGEADDVKSLYSKYVFVLAAIGPVAAFIGLSLIGAGGFGYVVRVPIVGGLVQMVLSYALSLGAVYVMSLIVDALAPSFGGTKSLINAFKLVAYGCTASFVGGIFNLLPMLSILGALFGLYSIYLIYTGLPVLMKCPPEKAGMYTAVTIVIGIVVFVVIGAIVSTIVGVAGFGAASAFGGRAGAHDVTIKSADGTVSFDTSKMQEMSRRMEAAGKKLEAAQASSDPAAIGRATSEMLGAMSGTTGQPIAPQDLKALLPESIGSFKRESIEATGGGAMGVNASTVNAGYVDGDKRVALTVTDMGGMAGLAALATWANLTVDKETADSIEKVYKQDNRTLREQYRKDKTHGEYTVVLTNGVVVEAKGDNGVDIAALKSAVGSLDLAKIEGMKRVAATK